jgi:hypothetical protein
LFINRPAKVPRPPTIRVLLGKDPVSELETDGNVSLTYFKVVKRAGSSRMDQ